MNRRRFLRSAATASAVAMSSSPSFGQEAATATGGPSDRPSHADCFALRKGGKKIPVIFDTDIGDDIDDTWALLYLLNSPELDVRLISVEKGHSRDRAKIVAKMLTAVGRTDIPIAMGPYPNGDCRQSTYVKDVDLDAYDGTVREDAAAAIVETVKASDDPMTVIGIGPVPVVADAVRLDPWIGNNARFIGMHGSIYRGYNDSPDPVPEYNVKKDPAALRTVFEADWETSITPLDTCGLLALTGEKYQRVFQADAPGVRDLLGNYKSWLLNADWVKGTKFEERSTTLFDIVAVTMAFSEEWFQMEKLPLEVTDEGATVINNSDGRPVRCALKWRDLSAYEDHVVERLIA